MGKIIKNKLIISFFLMFVGIFAFGLNSLAASNLNVNWPKSPFFDTELKDTSTLTELVKYLYEWGFGIAGLAVFIVLLIAGVQYLTSAGDAGKMKGAMDRINSAILGLILLLSSVLILNTINPQLTTLRTPSLGPEARNLSFPLFLSMISNMENCDKATFYKDIDFKGTTHEITQPGQESFEPEGWEINSIEFLGDCFLILYQTANYKSDDSHPSIMITGIEEGRKIENIGDLYGASKFKSAKLSNAGEFAASGACPAPVCLYENDEYNTKKQGLILLVTATQKLTKSLMNDNTSSVKVKDNYAAVLYDNDNYTGSCLRVSAPGIEKLPEISLTAMKLENDKTSAVSLFRIAKDQTLIPQGAVKLCENMAKDDGCQKGWTEEITKDTEQVQVNHNDQASRIELWPGYIAIIFRDTNYENECKVVTQTSDLSDFNDRASSIQIIKLLEAKNGGY